MRAQVFISCGQNAATGEVAVAERIREALHGLGYDPYVAVQQQTLRGLTDNIFRRLADSEYLLFIDFRREQLANASDYRGSLFSHQELAVAAFLGIDVLAFQEVGVLRLDGMIRFLQANPEPFTDRDALPDLVCAKVKDLWNPHWSKKLRLERTAGQFVDANSVNPRGEPAGIRRFFQASVVNPHLQRVASQAYVYLDELVREGDAAPERPKTVELKWTGYVFPNAVIRPGTSRDFDCCWIHHDDPSRAYLSSFSDATDYSPVIVGPGRFHMRFTALADQFEPQSLDVVLTLGLQLRDASLVAV